MDNDPYDHPCQDPICECQGFEPTSNQSSVCYCGHQISLHRPSPVQLRPRLCQSGESFRSAEANPAGNSVCSGCGRAYFTHTIPRTAISSSSTVTGPASTASSASSATAWQPPSQFLPPSNDNARREAGRQRSDLRRNRRPSPLSNDQAIGIASIGIAGSSRTSATPLRPPLLTYPSSTSRTQRERAMSRALGTSRQQAYRSYTFKVAISCLPEVHYASPKTIHAPPMGWKQVEFWERAVKLNLGFSWTTPPNAGPATLVAPSLDTTLLQYMTNHNRMFLNMEELQVPQGTMQTNLYWDVLMCAQKAKKAATASACLSKHHDTEMCTLGELVKSSERYSHKKRDSTANGDSEEELDYLLIIVPRYGQIVGAIDDEGTHFCLYTRLWLGLMTPSPVEACNLETVCDEFDCDKIAVSLETVNGTPIASPQASPRRVTRSHRQESSQPVSSSSSSASNALPSSAAASFFDLVSQPPSTIRQLSPSPTPLSPILESPHWRNVLVPATQDSPSDDGAAGFTEISFTLIDDFHIFCRTLLLQGPQSTSSDPFCIQANNVQEAADALWSSLQLLLDGRDVPVEYGTSHITNFSWETIGLERRHFDVGPAVGPGVERAVLAYLLDRLTKTSRFTSVAPGCVIPSLPAPSFPPTKTILDTYRGFGFLLKLLLLWGHCTAPVSPLVLLLLLRQSNVQAILDKETVEVLCPTSLERLGGWSPPDFTTTTLTPITDPVLLVMEVSSLELSDIQDMDQTTLSRLFTQLMSHLVWGDVRAATSPEYSQVFEAMQDGFDRMVGKEIEELSLQTYMQGNHGVAILKAIHSLNLISSPEQLIDVIDRRCSFISSAVMEQAQIQFIRQLCRWLRTSLRNSMAFIFVLSAERRLPPNESERFTILFKDPEINADNPTTTIHACSRTLEFPMGPDFESYAIRSSNEFDTLFVGLFGADDDTLNTV